MIQEIISAYNNRLAQRGFLNNYGLAEIKTSDDKSYPAIRNGSKFERIKITNVDASFFRKISKVNVKRSASQTIGCSTAIDLTYSMRFFILIDVLKYEQITPYSTDNTALIFIPLLQETKGIAQGISAFKVDAMVKAYDTDSQRIISDEFNGVNRNDFNYNNIVNTIDFDLVVKISEECINELCELDE